MPWICKHPDCNGGKNGKPKWASFAKTGEKPVRCKDHKDDDMVDVVHNLCTHPECNGGKNGQPKHAAFAKPGEKKAVRCALHREDDMVDVVSKLCTHPGCNGGKNGQPTIASFAKPGEKKPVRCALHKDEDMVDVVSKRNLCTHPGCNGGKNGQPTVATFAKPGEKKAVRCAVHKDDDMVDVVNKTCVSEWCTYLIANDKYDGYCTHCFKNLSPNDPRTPNIKAKTKEELVRDFINRNFEGFIHDMPIMWGGCDCNMRRRVDHRKLINGTMLAIETDEGQHKSYDAKKEEHRYDDLFFAHSGRWIFIRFNPDGYKDSKGKKRGGMFNSDGKRNQYEVDRRQKVLKEEIEKQIRRIENYENTDLLEIHKLFYDGSN